MSRRRRREWEVNSAREQVYESGLGGGARGARRMKDQKNTNLSQRETLAAVRPTVIVRERARTHTRCSEIIVVRGRPPPQRCTVVYTYYGFTCRELGARLRRTIQSIPAALSPWPPSPRPRHQHHQSCTRVTTVTWSADGRSENNNDKNEYYIL